MGWARHRYNRRMKAMRRRYGPKRALRDRLRHSEIGRLLIVGAFLCNKKYAVPKCVITQSLGMAHSLVTDELRQLVDAGLVVKEDWGRNGKRSWRYKWRVDEPPEPPVLPGYDVVLSWAWKGGPRVSLPMCVGLDNGFPKAVGPPHNALPMVIRK